MKKKKDDVTPKATVIAIVNQKGGAGKTTTCEDLGVGIAMEDKKVFLVDIASRHFEHIYRDTWMRMATVGRARASERR